MEYLDKTGLSTLVSKIKALLTGKADTSALSKVATSGSYGDLSDKPTIPPAVTVDAALSATSANPVQNKAVKTALDAKADTANLAKVATSGSYDDLSGKPAIPAAVTVDSSLSSTSANPVQSQAISAALAAKAPLASPTFSGTPTAPTAAAGTSSTQIATTAFVGGAVSSAIAGVTQIKFEFLSSHSPLPPTGTTGVIYFGFNAAGVDGDEYIEYVWNASTSKYEQIGTSRVDLKSYLQKTDLTAITDQEITAAFGS